ncbi:hypothetical protein [Acinetobacter sp. YH16039]|nr:hypothetical protein [Acinetobacter sp. YH16039]
MSQAASPFIQEQKFLDAFQQAIETHSFDRMIIRAYPVLISFFFST